MKTLSFILLSLFVLSCTHYSSQEWAKPNSARSYIKVLQKRKELIDQLPSKDTSTLFVFVKMTDKNKPVRIFNGKFPEDSIEYTYNVLTEKGKVIMIMSSPYSESGDWDVDITHYFDADGRTFAYEKIANAFVLPDDGVAYETTTNYFNPQFKNIKHIYKLIDKNKKALDKIYAFDREGFDNKIYPTSSECLKAYNINLNQ
jgi:hypothetical protein